MNIFFKNIIWLVILDFCGTRNPIILKLCLMLFFIWKQLVRYMQELSRIFGVKSILQMHFIVNNLERYFL